MSEKRLASKGHIRKEGEIIPQGISVTITAFAVYVYQRKGKVITCTRLPHGKAN